ncbi:MAG: Bug family tripartite tricarboxylate transporter substrate binding protein [Burkholderiales bacterium]
MTKRFLPILAAAMLPAISLQAFAQAYPAKLIRVVSTQTAGSPADVLLRQTAQKVSDSIAHPVVVEVQAGAAGVLAGQTVARAAPDGYTLLYTLASTIVTTPQLMKAKPFELKDFTPIVVVSLAATCMIASVTFAPNTIAEIVQAAKANPGKLAYGTNGIGGTYHLEMSLLSQKYGLDLIHVAYKSGVDALLAAATATLPIAYSPCASAQPHIRSGKVKIIATLEKKRLADLPDLPAMGEQVQDYEKVGGGVDMYAPAGVPAAIAKRIETEMQKALATPEVRARMKEISFFPDGMALEEMGAQRRKDLEVVAKAIKAAGLKPE